MCAEPTDTRAPVVMLWHMHQPEYRIDGTPLQPWTYLHAIRGYADMASHLEAVPEAKAVVNITPVLLDQLLDLARQAQAAVEGTLPREPLMAALMQIPAALPERRWLLTACTRTHARNAQDRHPGFRPLMQAATQALQSGDDAVASLPDGLLTDLVVWYHLVWMGDSVRTHDPRCARLLNQGHHFTIAQRRGLFELVVELLTTLLPRYRALSERGQIELSLTPYFHPLLPLMLDFESARENAPGTALPEGQYPDGAARARWHLETARARFKAIFGTVPRGCWPSEAAVSQATIELLHDLGFDWCATSQSVQNATLHRHGEHMLDAHSCMYRLAGNHLRCFFRDDGLSDRIGFVYKDWQPRDAVSDLTHQIEQLSDKRGGRTVVLALDGENPWEYYPENGIEFVRGLYRSLSSHPRLRMSTCSAVIDEDKELAPELPRIVSGSWVHGQLLTWVGHPEKNKAWSLLMEAKRCYDEYAVPDDIETAQVLGACEGSDWFWWPGAFNSQASVSDFDMLFRRHLQALYRRLGQPVPEVLNQPFSSALPSYGESAALGAMLPSH